MGFRKRTLSWLALLLASAVVLLYAAEKSPTRPEAPAPDAKEDLFSTTAIPRLQIKLSSQAMDRLRSHQGFGWGDAQSKRPEVQCTVRDGETVYTNVAIHLKGAAGSFRPLDDRPGLTLNFDKFAPGQKFHGLDKISLNNSVQDPSLLSEQISREMFLQAGVPVPRASHATVELNGRNLGLYVLVEGYNKTFLKRHFKSAKGNLYDGGFVREITEPLDLSSGNGPKDRSDLQRLAEAASDPDRARRFARLGMVLDMDRFIKFMALEVMTCHWDGYALNRNNYRIYHDPDTDKFVFMPHGMDQMFGVMRMRWDSPILGEMQGLVARAVMQTPEGHKRYMEAISQLTTNVFVAGTLTNRVRTIFAGMEPVLAERSTREVSYRRREMEELCERIEQRAKHIQTQLEMPRNVLAFDSGGVARLTGWKSRKSTIGKEKLDQLKDETGAPILHISMAEGSGTGSWRTRVVLEGGLYRIEGKIRTVDVTPDPGDRRAGAGFRMHQRPTMAEKLTGTKDWTTVGYNFEVNEGIAEVELVCELRAGKGEAWFNADTIRLIRK